MTENQTTAPASPDPLASSRERDAQLAELKAEAVLVAATAAETGTPRELEPGDRAVLERIVALGGVLFPLKPGIKKPSVEGWKEVRLTVNQAVAHLAGGGNLGMHLGASGLIAFDAENGPATQHVLRSGFQLTVAPAKSRIEGNKKYQGSHVWLRVPEGIDPTTLSSSGMQVKLAGGGLIDVLAGGKYVVAPPSTLSDAPGWAYTAYAGSPLDLAVPLEEAVIAEAPLWLFDPTLDCPAGLEPLRGCLAPKTSRDLAELDARSIELTEAIDQVPWAEWVAGDPRLTPTGEVDGCGCPIYTWTGADHDKSVTLHDGCEVGSGAHLWSGTMQSQLGVGDHVSRLDLACALRGESRSKTAASVGIRLGGEQEFDVINPDDLEEAAAEFEATAEAGGATETAPTTGTRLADGTGVGKVIRVEVGADGLLRRAAAFRSAAAVMRARQHDVATQGGAVLIGADSVVGAPAGLAAAPAIGGLGGPAPAGATAPPMPRQHSGAGPFPVHALPKVLRDFAVAVADSMAVPVELVAPMQIAVLAAGCGPCNIYVTDGWEAEPGAVWIMIVSPPSTRKTPVLKVVKAPMEEAVRIVNDALGEQRAELQMEADALAEAADEAELDAKAAMKKAAKELADDPAAVARAASATAAAEANGTWVPPTTQGLASELAAKAAKLKRMAEDAQAAVPPVVEPVFTDATPEAMMELLARQRGRGFLIHPEASEILTAATRADTKGMETAKFNSAYDEEYISTHRITRAVTEVDRPSMCSLLIVQPDPVAEAYAPRQNGVKSRITTNGWSDRQGFVLVPESEPDSLRRDRSIDPAARAAYTEAVSREWIRTYMLSATDREAWANLRFRLTPEAFEVIADHYDLVERIKRQPGTRAESWGKVIGRAVRIARCFAQLDVAVLDGKQVYPIEAHHMQAGWEIAQWMMRSFDAATNAPETVTITELVEQAAAYVLEKIPAVGDAIMRPKVRSSKRHGPYIEAALEMLTARGQVGVRGQEIHRVALLAA